jgi:ketosteroid isomerase-like protein
MKAFKILLLVTGIIVFGNCTQKNELSEAEKLRISEEIQVRANGYPVALKNKDLKWFHNFWSDEEGFVFAGDGQIETDYEAFTQQLSDIFQNLEEVIHFEFTNGHVCVLGRDAASFVANFDWGMVMNSGDTLQAKGSWLYVFRKTDDQWKVFHSAGTHIYY